jgi:citrate lyase subunit beta/citryl-CoA lyase
MPGSNERALEKAKTIPADAPIFDLEDAVPDQVWPCNEIFSRTREEVEWSRKIITAFRQPENTKKGVIVIEGRMIEPLHLGMAERTVSIAEQIRQMETACV